MTLKELLADRIVGLTGGTGHGGIGDLDDNDYPYVGAIRINNPFKDIRSGLTPNVLHAVHLWAAKDQNGARTALDDEYNRCGNVPRKIPGFPPPPKYSDLLTALVEYGETLSKESVQRKFVFEMCQDLIKQKYLA
jgi:hypothetical protein